MHPFTDSRGRVWQLTINVNALRAVKSACGVDLLRIVTLEENNVNVDLLEQLAADPCLLVDILYTLCEPHSKGGLSPQDFAEALDGDTLEAATAALLDAVIDFFPRAKRLALQKILAASRRFATQQAQTLEALINAPELETAIAQALAPSGI